MFGPMLMFQVLVVEKSFLSRLARPTKPDDVREETTCSNHYDGDITMPSENGSLTSIFINTF